MKVLQFLMDNYAGISGIIMSIMALYKAFQKIDKDRADKDKITKFQLIKELVPYIHDLVEKSAKFTDTKKDDAFLDQITKAMKALGYDIKEEDHEGIKVLGAAEHNFVKKAKEAEEVSEVVGKSEEA